jgi:hypothetical protein
LAETKGLIASYEMNDVAYLRLCSHKADDPAE